ncbi:MAG: hypothetical protein ACREHG_04910 [Candidatus Saccharimonadales bacterium]
MQLDKPRWITPAKSTWTPPVLYVLDTESKQVDVGPNQVHTLRCWVSATINRKDHGIDSHYWRWSDGTTAAGLAYSIDDATAHTDTLWIYAHNLSFDLATTRIPEHLAGLGWEATDFALSGDTPWLRMKKGRRRIVLVDSFSWLPMEVEEMGRLIDRKKVRMPAPNASDRQWIKRCRADVAILAESLLHIMAWHDAEGLGKWSLSGTATAWGHLRHRLRGPAVLVDPDPELQARDRAAMYGGRRQAWQVGEFTGHVYTEIDFSAAYPNAAGVMLLPQARLDSFDSLPIKHEVFGDQRYGLLADVRVRTDKPRYPLRVDGQVFYPTGEFWTTLAGPEIDEAHRTGRLLEIGRGQVHQLARYLDDWAAWLFDVAGEIGDKAPLVMGPGLKLWSRSVLGRFAGHKWERSELGPASGVGWRYEPGVDASTGQPGGVMELGGRSYWSQQCEGSQTAYPAVTAWVESFVRVALGRVIDAVGVGALVSADTDGLLVAERLLGTDLAGGTLRAPAGMSGKQRVRWVLDRASDMVAPLRLEPKRSSTHCRVLGPQHRLLGNQRTLPGIPGSAAEVAVDTFSYHAWPSIAWQLSEGGSDGYSRPEMVRRLEGPYVAGWVLDDGSVFPPHAHIDGDGWTRLTAWPRTPKRPAHRKVDGPQHPVLDALY